ncbi:hypothetical protein Tco_0785317, partial [Tanacetum coccineum]
MNVEKLQKMVGVVRTGGNGSVRSYGHMPFSSGPKSTYKVHSSSPYTHRHCVCQVTEGLESLLVSRDLDFVPGKDGAKYDKRKHTSSEVHHQADSRSVPACVSTGRSDMTVAIIGDASPSFYVVPAANKDTAAHDMVFNQSVHKQLGMPSLVTHASPKLLDSSSSFVKRKRTPEEDPMTSQMHPEVKSKKVRTRLGTDHRNTVVVINNPASQTLDTKAIATTNATPYHEYYVKCVLTQKALDAFCNKFHILEEVHPVLPNHNDTMHERPAGKIELHFRINISQLSVIGAAKVSHFEILCRVYGIIPTVGLFRCFYVNSKKSGWMSLSKRSDNAFVCYTKPLDSLKNYNDHFFWVDDFACPASFLWHTAKHVTRDPDPVAADFNIQDYATLVAHPSPFRKFPEAFMCLVGLSRHYTLDEETYPWFLHKNGEGGCLLLYMC